MPLIYYAMPVSDTKLSCVSDNISPHFVSGATRKTTACLSFDRGIAWPTLGYIIYYMTHESYWLSTVLLAKTPIAQCVKGPFGSICKLNYRRSSYSGSSCESGSFVHSFCVSDSEGFSPETLR